MGLRWGGKGSQTIAVCDIGVLDFDPFTFVQLNELGKRSCYTWWFKGWARAATMCRLFLQSGFLGNAYNLACI